MQYYAVPTIKYNAVFKEKWFMFVDKKRKKKIRGTICYVTVPHTSTFCFVQLDILFFSYKKYIYQWGCASTAGHRPANSHDLIKLL